MKEDRLVFGELENIKVGQIFKDRDELSKARLEYMVQQCLVSGEEKVKERAQ